MEFLKSFLDSYGMAMTVIMLVAASAVYIVKILKDIRKRKPYNSITIRLNLLKITCLACQYALPEIPFCFMGKPIS